MAFPPVETNETRDVLAVDRAGAEVGEGVDFASRQAARGKMQLWVTAFTAAAALLVLAVVSMSALHAAG
jgi:hypothetical protein